MARTWWSIRVELVSGRGDDYWPRPGRIFATARAHTFGQLAAAIDIAFARWDRAHLNMFTLADGTTVTPLRYWDGDPPDDSVDSDTTKLSRLQAGDQFAYTFDLGDEWTHLCTVDPEKIDPMEALGMTPAQPLAYWGWGDLPDQYGRHWDGEAAPPRRPSRPLADLPPILPWWGPQRRR